MRSPERRAYMRDLAAAADKIKAKYLLDDMDDWPAAALDEMDQAAAELNRQHGRTPV